MPEVKNQNREVRLTVGMQKQQKARVQRIRDKQTKFGVRSAPWEERQLQMKKVQH